MNVALTRAKCSLFVIGNAHTLSHSEPWKQLIDEAISRRCIYDVSESFDAQSQLLNKLLLIVHKISLVKSCRHTRHSAEEFNWILIRQT
jgi:superfamily I DNA and/or RNA helicase